MKKLLLLVALAVLSLCAEAKVYLVAVGVSDYPGTRNDLRMPHNDAATIDWLYRENGQAETVLLMNAQATVSRVCQSMQRLYAKAGASDIVVLFFSGHGVKGGFVCYDGFLTYADIRRIMAQSRSQSKMVFADACFSGAFRRKGSQQDGSWTGSNIMLFLSCRTNEMSIERPGMTNGLFIYALQHGLRGGADANRDRTITARELFNYVSRKVQQTSGNHQHPVMWGKFADSMTVMKWKNK